MTDAHSQPVMLIESVREDIVRRGLIPPQSRLLVAVSGGADSTALLLVLAALAPEFGWSVRAAHFNHAMRAGADADEAFVSALCRSLGVTLISARSGALGPGSSEEAARDERLAFLLKSAARCQAQLIATGHTADDCAETVLLNLIRGAGVDGLRGIRWAGGPFVRPLLGRSRGEIRAFLEERGQAWREDESNASVAYARNRLRHNLLPLLEREFNADVRGALLRLAATAGEDADYLNGLARELVPELLLSRDETSVRLSRPALRSAPLALARRCVREVVAELLQSPRDITFSVVERILGAAEEPVPAFDAGLGLSVRSDDSAVTIALPAQEPAPFDRGLLPGVTEVPEAGCVFCVGDEADPRGGPTLRTAPPAGALHVRSWRAGDRMRPRGLGGSKKLQDIFTDAKIPRTKRGKFPVVCVDEEIIWLPGLAVAESVTPGPLVIGVRPLTP